MNLGFEKPEVICLLELKQVELLQNKFQIKENFAI